MPTVTDRHGVQQLVQQGAQPYFSDSLFFEPGKIRRKVAPPAGLGCFVEAGKTATRIRIKNRILIGFARRTMADDAVGAVLFQHAYVSGMRFHTQPFPAALFKGQGIAETSAVDASDLDGAPAATARPVAPEGAAQPSDARPGRRSGL